MNAHNKLPRVVIVGAGFGGLKAARALADAPVQITLIDRNNYHLFQPLLYQVASAGVAPSEIAYPVRAVFRGQKNLDFQMAEVRRIDLADCRLITERGELEYDYLILAAGGQTNFFGMESVECNAFDLKELGNAVDIRNHVLRQFELAALEPDAGARRAMLTFVVAGGGPTGVEMSGALSELIRLVLAKDFPRLPVQDARVLLLEAGGKAHVLSRVPISYALFTKNPRANWLYSSEPEESTGGRRIPVPRGRMLGGSRSINGLGWVRGHRLDYDHWAQLGCRGWSWEDVLPLFKAMEDFEGGDDDLRGKGGPIRVTTVPENLELYRSFFEACRAVGIERTQDHNGHVQTGAGMTQGESFA